MTKKNFALLHDSILETLAKPPLPLAELLAVPAVRNQALRSIYAGPAYRQARAQK